MPIQPPVAHALPCAHLRRPDPGWAPRVWGILLAALACLVIVLAASVNQAQAQAFAAVPLLEAGFTEDGDFACAEDRVPTASPQGISCQPANPGVSLWDSSLAADDHDDADRELLVFFSPCLTARPLTVPVAPLVPGAEFQHCPPLRPPRHLA